MKKDNKYFIQNEKDFSILIVWVQEQQLQQNKNKKQKS